MANGMLLLIEYNLNRRRWMNEALHVKKCISDYRTLAKYLHRNALLARGQEENARYTDIRGSVFQRILLHLVTIIVKYLNEVVSNAYRN